VAARQELVHFLPESIIGARSGSHTQLVAGQRVQCPGTNSRGTGVGPVTPSTTTGLPGTAQVGHALGHHGQGLGEFEPSQV
jgi:hypothetical protein